MTPEINVSLSRVAVIQYSGDWREKIHNIAKDYGTFLSISPSTGPRDLEQEPSRTFIFRKKYG